MKPADVIDRRVFGRRKTDIKAQVRAGNRIVPCTIKDMSEGGALLEFSEHQDLPQRLWLSWSEQGEIVCEVRHTRRNTAGVQFSRPQALTLRTAAPPAEAIAGLSIAVAKAPDRPACSSGAELIAGMRRAIRHPMSDVAETPAAPGTPPAAQPDDATPRDISTLMASLKAAAAQIVQARAIAAVPRPLPAWRYALASVEPESPAIGATASPQQLVRVIAADDHATVCAGEQAPADPPCALAGALTFFVAAPVPLPASAYAAAL